MSHLARSFCFCGSKWQEQQQQQQQQQAAAATAAAFPHFKCPKPTPCPTVPPTNMSRALISRLPLRFSRGPSPRGPSQLLPILRPLSHNNTVGRASTFGHSKTATSLGVAVAFTAGNALPPPLPPAPPSHQNVYIPPPPPPRSFAFGTRRRRFLEPLRDAAPPPPSTGKGCGSNAKGQDCAVSVRAFVALLYFCNTFTCTMCAHSAAKLKRFWTSTRFRIRVLR
jgi:hypothetical protein